MAHDPFEDTVPDPTTQPDPPDGGGSLLPPASSGYPVPWLVTITKHLIPRIGAYALATPLAFKLPGLLGMATETGNVWPAVIAGIIILAVGAPTALKDVSELVRSIRSGAK